MVKLSGQLQYALEIINSVRIDLIHSEDDDFVAEEGSLAMIELDLQNNIEKLRKADK